MRYDLTEIFYFCDEFYKHFSPELKNRSLGKEPTSRFSTPEVMAVLVAFHCSGYHDFKHFYSFIRTYHKKAFPNIVSYSRFVELISNASIYLFVMLKSMTADNKAEVAFIDATSIAVCKNKRIFSHRVFKQLAKRGKTTMGWFYGFKLHLSINEKGQILNFSFGPGNEDDRKHAEAVLEGFEGTAYGDKGYISKDLFKNLFDKGIKLVTSIRSNMKPQIMTQKESDILGKRSLIESVFNVLKHSCRIEHSRHRSTKNFVSNLLGALCSYSLRFFLTESTKINAVNS